MENNDSNSNIGSHGEGGGSGGGGDAKAKTSPEDSSVFDSLGVLEHILSFVDTQTLLNATLVTRRFKKAGRHDDLWIEAIKRLWKDKKGVYYDSFSEDGVAASAASASAKPQPSRTTNQNQDSLPNPQNQPALQQPYNNLIFWRSLFAKELVEKMTEEQIRCFLFGHPLLEWKSNQFEQQQQQQQLASTSAKTSETPPVITGTSFSSSAEQQQHEKEEGRSSLLQRFVQLHMLDIMSDLTSEEVQQSVFTSVFGGNEGVENDLNDFDDDDDDCDDDDDDDNEDTDHGYNGFDDDDGDMINARQRQGRREQEQRRQRRTQRQRALPRRHFFSDLYFGSYACSVMDSYRCRLTQIELCRPYGWLLYFKVDANELLEDLLEHPRDDDDEEEQEDVGEEILLHLMDDDENGSDEEEDDDDDDDDGDFNYAHAAARRGCLEVYERSPQILLYKHSFCYFDTPESTNGGVSSKDGTSTQSSDFFGNANRGRKFRMEVLDHVENIVSSDLQWRWAVNGSKVQVGPYPPLKVKRRSDDWGWELENQHVVMRSLEYDRQHPEPRRSLPEVFVHAIADAESERDRRRRRRRVRDRHRQRHQARP